MSEDHGYAPYPDGRLNPEDEGETPVHISTDDGRVVLRFDKPLMWLGMTPQQACDVASGMIKYAREAAREQGVVITVSIPGGGLAGDRAEQ